ncbi:MAG: hypothetical protein GQ574_14480 [Crocinitomix sp.]|nr:hypothetical protein [Crocinitomix sp.]
MRKLLLVAIALLSVSTSVKAQDSFYEGVLKFDGVEFQEIYTLENVVDKEGYYRPGSLGRTVTFKVKKTKKGNFCAVSAFEKDGDSRGFVITDQITDYNTFSYAYPGVVVHKYTGKGYVFIDSMLITLEGVTRDGLSYKNIGRIYWVKLTEAEIAADAEAKEAAKAKMTMKEKVAAAKNVVKNGIKGNVRYEKVVNTNMDELIKNYLKTMNDKHLAGDKAKEAAIKADIKMEQDAFLKDRQKDSREYADKLNAQKDGGDTKFTIKNNSSERIYVMTEMGSSSWISAGGSSTYPCGNKMYHCSMDAHNTYNVKGALIADGKTACGKTVNVE